MGLLRIPADEGFFSYTKSLTPAAIDLELRSLVTLDTLHKFTNAVTSRLRLHRDFEATQTLLNVFLRVYADEIIANEELRHGLEALLEVQKQESQRILELIASSSGKLNFVRDVM
jgi:U3 small nucleolar RNA-associated protein 21